MASAGAPILDSLPKGYSWVMVPNDIAKQQELEPQALKYDPSNKEIRDYEYEPLRNLTTSIRLLKLIAADVENPDVRCQLFEGEFKDDQVIDPNNETKEVIKYEAVSWAWGNEPFEYQLLIENGDHLFRLKASLNLIQTLKYLRHKNMNRIIWVDAVCIDLDDFAERNHQVQMMSKIYGNAIRVCVWLGDADEHSSRAIHFIQRQILQLQNFDELCDDERNSKNGSPS